MEKIVNETITKIVNQVKNQLEKEGIKGADTAFHLGRIKYIQSDKPDEITLEYPLEKGTYHNCSTITITEDGKVNIKGTQTSAEKRNKQVKRNGAFDVDVQLENWKEPDAMDLIRENQWGYYEPEKGILDYEEAATKVNTQKMWNGMVGKFPELEDEGTTFWLGQGLPKIPCLEQFEDGTEVLIVTPKDAEKVLKAKENVSLFANVYHWSQGDLFDYSKSDIDQVYVVSESEIAEGKENYQKEFESYKGTILELLDKKPEVSQYINEDLMKDEEIRKKLNIHSIEDVTEYVETMDGSHRLTSTIQEMVATQKRKKNFVKNLEELEQE